MCDLLDYYHIKKAVDKTSYFIFAAGTCRFTLYSRHCRRGIREMYKKEVMDFCLELCVCVWSVYTILCSCESWSNKTKEETMHIEAHSKQSIKDLAKFMRFVTTLYWLFIDFYCIGFTFYILHCIYIYIYWLRGVWLWGEEQLLKQFSLEFIFKEEIIARKDFDSVFL